ncbi:hypothetical protein [Bradyrhizobium sp. 62B]
MTGRSCHGVELNPEYCGLAIARWEQVSARKARLISRAA